ncbi:hypothetical protein LCGC14_2358550 [marine sediment metagenome]|uniref:Peptidoglycan recognition protein family domain-containing protein n=1 Tax=marine sediment metagenome TaxID=412755 RepID=A0A0F9CUJ7_9ZZZZ
MKPTYLIIHHTATSRDKTTFAAVKKYHIKKGWGNIGYHFFIESDGTLYGYPQARGQDQVGAHARADGMNYKSIGIALTGNFQMEEPKPEQIKTLNRIVKDLMKVWKIPKKNILGHREVKGALTVCPGDNLIPYIKELRADVKDSNNKDDNDLLREDNIILRREKTELKQKYIKCSNKVKSKLDVIRQLKVALSSKKTWVDKLLNLIKKNEDN